MQLSAVTQNLKKVWNTFVRDVWKNGVDFSHSMFTAQSAILTDALVRGWKGKKAITLALENTTDIITQFGAEDAAIVAEMQRNIYMFSGAKTYTVAKEMNLLLQESKTFSQFQKNTQGLYDSYYDRFLQSEYNLAYTTAQQSAQYHRMVDDKEEYPTWIYRTVGDRRVREAHRALDGKAFRADDPVWDTIYPPNGWGCRCWVEPSASKPTKYATEEDATEALGNTTVDSKGTTELERMRKEGFAVNRAKEKYIYAEDWAYFEHADKRKLKKLADEMMEGGDTQVQLYKAKNGSEVTAHVSALSQDEFDKNFAAGKWLADNKRWSVDLHAYDPTARKGENPDAYIRKMGDWEFKTPDAATANAFKKSVSGAKAQGADRVLIHNVTKIPARDLARAIKGQMAFYQGGFKRVLVIHGNRLYDYTYKEIMAGGWIDKAFKSE